MQKYTKLSLCFPGVQRSHAHVEEGEPKDSSKAGSHSMFYVCIILYNVAIMYCVVGSFPFGNNTLLA